MTSNNSTPENKAPFEPVDYVCGGLRFEDGSLNLHLFLLNGEQLGEPRIYGANKRTKDFLAGSMYRVPTSGTSIRAGDGEWIGKWPDKEQIAAWQAATRGAQVQANAAKMTGTEELLKQLEPMRKLYSGTIGTIRRTALELAVLNALRTPVKKR